MSVLSKTRRIAIAVLLISSLHLPVFRMSLAQGPEDLVLAPESVPAGELVPTSEVAQSAGKRAKDITWGDLEYSDRELSAGIPCIWIEFNVPGDLVLAPGSYVNLVVTHTGGQAEQPSRVMVELNGYMLGIVRLAEGNAERGEIQLDILPEWLRIGHNKFKVTLLTDTEVCYQTDEPQPERPSVQVVLHSEGYVHLEYETFPREPDLAHYPAPFFEYGFEPSVVYFVLPDSPTPEDITVAATVSAGLGRYSTGEIQIRSIMPSELTAEVLDNYNMIAIGLPETNVFYSQLPLPMSPELADIPDDHGVLLEMTSPWNPRRMVLGVMGRTWAGVFKAGAALNRPVSFPGFKGQTAVIEKLFDPDELEAGPPVADRTLEDLGYWDTVVCGTRPDSHRFFFYLPGFWQMSDDPSLKLFFTHSEILSGTVSALSVHLNDVPIGSTLLDPSNSTDGLLEVELPRWLIQDVKNTIQIVVDMSMGEDECLYWRSDQVWTVISRKSVLHLPYEPKPVELDLANLFRPFTDEPNLGDMCIVLPEALGPVERDALLNLAVRLGAAAGGTCLALCVDEPGNVDFELKRNNHIVAIGRPSTNSIIREVNDRLPQPFLPDSDEPSQIHNPAVLVFDPQRSVGFVQLMASPWNPDKVLLVVTGTDDEGVVEAVDLLLNSAGSLEGNVAMIEDDSLTTIDTRPPRAEADADFLHVVRPGTSVLVALVERWW